MDCIYTKEELRFLSSDLNGSVKLDGEAAALACAIAAKEGLPATTMPIAFLTGGTDAAELAKAGARALSLIAMAWSNGTRSSVYHTPGDTVDAVESSALEAAIRIGVGFVEAVEEGALE